MQSVAANLASVRESVARAADRSGRPGSVRLIAVSKGHSSEAVREAFVAGQRDFGENYAQELAQKALALDDLDGLAWHFTGHLQRNKAKEVMRLASVIHTVDREELAREIDKRSSGAIGVFLEVNIGREPQKSGCAPEDVGALARTMLAMDHLGLLGLMAVPPMAEDPEASRPFFAELRTLATRLLDDGLVPAPLELSMGMSHDFEVAIEEGATVVRVGTSIFGQRSSGGA